MDSRNCNSRLSLHQINEQGRGALGETATIFAKTIRLEWVEQPTWLLSAATCRRDSSARNANCLVCRPTRKTGGLVARQNGQVARSTRQVARSVQIQLNRSGLEPARG